MTHDDAGSRLDTATGVSLAAMALGIFVIANDFTALSVAVVPIENDLDSTLNRAQWVINAYTVVFGVLIVTGGRLADLYGRRRVFMIGAAIFAVFSLLGGLAPNIETLIVARALMGIGGALMWPSLLGMTYGVLPEDKGQPRRRSGDRRCRSGQRNRSVDRWVAHRRAQLALGVLRQRSDRRP